MKAILCKLVFNVVFFWHLPKLKQLCSIAYTNHVITTFRSGHIHLWCPQWSFHWFSTVFSHLSAAQDARPSSAKHTVDHLWPLWLTPFAARDQKNGSGLLLLDSCTFQCLCRGKYPCSYSGFKLGVSFMGGWDQSLNWLRQFIYSFY